MLKSIGDQNISKYGRIKQNMSRSLEDGDLKSPSIRDVIYERILISTSKVIIQFLSYNAVV